MRQLSQNKVQLANQLNHKRKLQRAGVLSWNGQNARNPKDTPTFDDVSVSSITTTAADVLFVTGEDADVFYLVQLAADPAPTQEVVLTTGEKISVSNNQVIVSLDSLTTLTTYAAYAVYRAHIDGKESDVATVTFDTA